MLTDRRRSPGWTVFWVFFFKRPPSVDVLKVLATVYPCRHVCVSCQFQKVVHLMSQKAWRIADLFSAVLQFCESRGEEGRSLSGLFDWLLETL